MAGVGTCIQSGEVSIFTSGRSEAKALDHASKLVDGFVAFVGVALSTLLGIDDLADRFGAVGRLVSIASSMSYWPSAIPHESRWSEIAWLQSKVFPYS